MGPTGIGKTALSISIAKGLETEIVSCDSRQFFKEMPIGTAAPTPSELSEVPHHFVLNRSILEPYSIGQYEQDALNLLKELFSRYNNIVLVGGSMMYEKALIKGLNNLPTASAENQQKLKEIWNTEGLEALQQILLELDPKYYSEVDLQNPRRLLRAIDIIWQTQKPYSLLLEEEKSPRPFNVIRIGIKAPRELIYERINKRVDKMMELGLLEEAKALYPHKDLTALNTVGYKEIFKYLDGEWDLDFTIEEIMKNSRRFAKRQLTWYNGEEDIYWSEMQNVFENSMNHLREQGIITP